MKEKFRIVASAAATVTAAVRSIASFAFATRLFVFLLKKNEKNKIE